MAGSLIFVPFFLCVLCLMLCGSVADSRAVILGARFQTSVDEYDIDDGPQTFTMQDHLNYLRERELVRRGRVKAGSVSASLAATSRLEEQNSPVFVDDYHATEANKHNIPSD